MSIVKMKRVRLIALSHDRDALLSDLLHGGCVEVSEPTQTLADESYAALLRREPAQLAQAKAAQNELKLALETLDRCAPQKGKLFAPKDRVAERDLMDRAVLDRGLELAGEINRRAKAMGACSARETRLTADKLSLQPWSSYELPLEDRGSRTVSVLLGAVPNTVDFQAMAGAVEEAAQAVTVSLLHSDREQHYLEILCHRSCEHAALEVLRTYGFSFAQLKDLTGTVGENIHRLDGEILQAQRDRQTELDAIAALGSRRQELKLAFDQAAQVVATESTKERLLGGGAIVYLDGWLPAADTPGLERTLAKYDCAYEITEPVPEEYPQVPIKLKNNALTRPLNMVTEMYSLPAYDGVDPNPLMAPFFITFFGLMMADMAYGLVMIIGGWFILKKMKAKGTMAHMGGIGILCGISTLIFGALTGGFMGDFIPQIAKLINPNTTLTALPALFTPLDDTIAILIGSLVLGLIQIITGMAISVVRKIQGGDFIDALFDEITWWIILAGIALAILGIGNVAGVPVVLVVGALMLAVGGTRQAKGFGKVTKLVGLVYNGVSGFFSDTFSYARLMALMLAGSVIAQVFNTLGSVTGNVVGFVLISLVGNTLNLVLNLLGCYVHDLRLQCLEYFGRFYKDGGKPYRPLAIQTKYVDIIKEEN